MSIKPMWAIGLFVTLSVGVLLAAGLGYLPFGEEQQSSVPEPPAAATNPSAERTAPATAGHDITLAPAPSSTPTTPTTKVASPATPPSTAGAPAAQQSAPAPAPQAPSPASTAQTTPASPAAPPSPPVPPAPTKAAPSAVPPTPPAAPPASMATAPSAPPSPALPAEADMSEPNRRQVQQALHQLGYDPGPVDGVFGPRTRGAIRRFQRDIGAKPTGSLTAQEASRLATTPAPAASR